MNKEEIKLTDAVKVLTEALKKSNDQSSLYYTWQSNIAMPIIDTFNKYAEENEIVGSAMNLDIHKIANDGAKKFLDLLISQIEK